MEEINKDYGRKEIGSALQKVKLGKKELRDEIFYCSFIYCMIYELFIECSNLVDPKNVFTNEISKKTISKYEKLNNFILQEELFGCWEMEPLVKGDFIKESILKSTEPFSFICELIDQQILKQLDEPNITPPQMVEYLNSNYKIFVEESEKKKRKK